MVVKAGSVLGYRLVCTISHPWRMANAELDL